MGSKEIQQMYIRIRVDSLVIVALSAEPPGVNENCVCVSHNIEYQCQGNCKMMENCVYSFLK